MLEKKELKYPSEMYPRSSLTTFLSKLLVNTIQSDNTKQGPPLKHEKFKTKKDLFQEKLQSCVHGKRLKYKKGGDQNQVFPFPFYKNKGNHLS